MNTVQLGHSVSASSQFRNEWFFIRHFLLVAGLLLTFAACDAPDATPRSDAIPKTSAAANSASTTAATSRKHKAPLDSEPLKANAAEDAPSSMAFERLSPESTGVDFVSELDANHPMRYLYHSGSSVGGVAIGDVDGDERPDLFFAGGPGSNHLYLQKEGLKFEEITESAGVGGGDRWGTGAALVDIDGDGDLDIYVANYESPNQLFINQGDETFVEEAAKWGVDVVGACLMPSFCDYDCDGDLDFYLLTTRTHDPEGLPAGAPILTTVEGKSEIIPSKRKYWQAHFDGQGWIAVPRQTPDMLFRNNGDQSFTDVTKSAGIKSEGDGLAATWWDYNDDGLPDLYVSNDFEAPDHLYQNNGDGSFTDVIREQIPHSAWFSMGADAGDLNNDGRVDFIAADMSSTSHYMEKTTMGAMGRKAEFLTTAEPRQYMRNALYLNTGTKRFMEAAYLAGLADSDWTWSIKIADLDNDGKSDVYITNGAAKNSNDSDLNINSENLSGAFIWDLYKDVPPRKEQNLAFRNLGELRFENESERWGLAHVGMSYGAALSDLDRDGDLDLVVVNLDEPVSIYRNDAPDGNRILVRLIGQKSNTHGIGASVRVKSASSEQVRQLKLASGFLACDEPIAHFGLGADSKVDHLTVNWPSGAVQEFRDLDVNRIYTITEEVAADSPDAVPAADVKPLFASSSALDQVRHAERPFDDFERQPLLPNQLSQLGPGLAVGDVDGDGDDDLYIAGAAGAAGQMILADGQGGFEAVDDLSQPFFKDAGAEDMAPLFLDVDGDGDLDLFVVSGGVECEPGDVVLRDRLYLNDGSGVFTRSNDAIPDLRDSGGAACAADFDRDGDLDLFVGGRSIPGEYPLAPKSRILVNDGNGVFSDATESVAPELLKTGLVTGATWSDANGDGWIDLLVAHEWGPVKFFANIEGKLVDRTREAGLSERLGWWNAISGRDVDNDGDIDFFVANFGLNTKYHASPEKPALLYYGDFDKSGKMALVEAEFEDEHLFPIRGRSCSSNAMPFIKDKFSSYKDYAVAELNDIYTPECLEEAHRFECNCLESGMLINDGAGKFAFRPAPRLAQIAPAFGLAMADVNGDGNCDVYLVNNFFSPQVETGRMDGGLSQLLLGRGDGEFDVAWPKESGLIVAGDAKGLVTTDINGDGWPDFIVTRNNDRAIAFENQPAANQSLEVKLQGPPKNPSAVGALVTFVFDDGSKQSAEVTAGGGYLSQASPAIYFGAPDGRTPKEITVRWPDGSTTSTAPTAAPDGGPWRMSISRSAS